ncbi:MAG: hypothetical protein CMO47_01785 [Verrucomicrobiales bacterium]|nr:hypothetical protein [Verrucomicrobiales bacterium]
MTELEEKQQLSEMLDKAWPKERLEKLGPTQKKLLVGMFETEKNELTLPIVAGLLEEVEEYFPEEMIHSSKLLDPLIQIGSESLA